MAPFALMAPGFGEMEAVCPFMLAPLTEMAAAFVEMAPPFMEMGPAFAEMGAS
jgi:hypothetical protein